MKGQSLKKQAMVTAGGSALVRAMGFGLRILLSRLLGAEALGIMELASGVHMLALTPAAAGLPSAVSRLTAKAETEEEKQLTLYAGRSLALGMGVWAAAALLLLAPALSRALGDERTLPSLLFFVPCVMTVGVSCVYDGYFLGRGRALPPAVSELAEQIVRMGVIAAFASLVGRVTPAWRAALPAAASSFGETVGLAVICFAAGSIPSFRGDRRLHERKRALRKLSLPLVLNRFSHTALRSLCSVMIPLRLAAGGMQQAEAMSRLGMLNGMVMPLMLLPGLISGALSAVGCPAIARCRTRKGESRLARKLLLAALGAGAVSMAGLYLCSPFIACRIYHLPELTPLIRSSCFLAVLLPVQQTLSGLMTGLGLQKHSLIASLLGAGFTLLCTWLWTSRQGIQGAAFAVMAGHGLTTLWELTVWRNRSVLRGIAGEACEKNEDVLTAD